MNFFTFAKLGRALLMLTAIVAVGLLGCGGGDDNPTGGGGGLGGDIGTPPKKWTPPLTPPF
ncbi:MAG: hypothetical protein LBC59_06005 [Chitinispirillales bacterium]|nr:hypothetical protein [Chitinispirillales bacterium]